MTYADCDKAFKGMQAGPDAVKRKYASCTNDGDCDTIPSRACLGACETAINKAGVLEHQRAMRATDAACSAFIHGPCMYTYPVAVPTCPMYIPYCVNGACVAKMK